MSKHYHHTLKAPELPDIHLPTGHWDLDDVDAVLDDIREIKAKFGKYITEFAKDLTIYFGAAADPARIAMFVDEEVDGCLANPLEQVRDFIGDEAAGPHRWHQEHSTYRAVNGRVA